MSERLISTALRKLVAIASAEYKRRTDEDYQDSGPSAKVQTLARLASDWHIESDEESDDKESDDKESEDKESDDK